MQTAFAAGYWTECKLIKYCRWRCRRIVDNMQSYRSCHRQTLQAVQWKEYKFVETGADSVTGGAALTKADSMSRQNFMK